MAALAGVYAASPWIVEYNARKIARAEDVSIEVFEMDYPGSESIHFNELRFQVAGFAIVAKNIDVQYSITNLEITHVQIETLAANSSDSSETVATAPFTINDLITRIEAAWQQLPAQTVVIKTLNFSTDVFDLRLSGNLALDQSQLSITVSKLHTTRVPDLNGKVELNRNGTLNLALSESSNGNMISLSADIPQGSFKHNIQVKENAFSINSQGNGRWTSDKISLQLEDTELQISGVLWDNSDSSLQVSHPNRLVNLSVNTNNLAISEGLVIKFESGEGEIGLQVHKLITDLELAEIEITGALSFASVNENITGASLFEAHLSNLSSLHTTLSPVASTSFLSVQSEGVVIKLAEPLPLFIDIESLTYLTEPTQIVVASDQFEGETLTIALENLKGTADQTLKGNLTIHYPLLALYLPAKVSWAAPELKVDFYFDHTISVAPLAALTDTYNMDLKSGRLHGKGLATWQPTTDTLEVQLSAFADGVSGVYQDVPFSGLKGAFEIRYHAEAIELTSSALEINNLDVGFPLTAMKANVAFKKRQVLVTDFSVDAFAGTVTAANIAYDLQSGSSQFTLLADRLSLAEVLALEGDQITGTGLLSGQIPLVITDNTITVTDGQFSSLSPGGIIRYSDAREAAVSLEQQGFGFAIGALANFHYKSLKAGINYLSSGDMSLAIRLEGHNPEIEKGREIHYNLNISENIPALLRSLQLSDEITEKVEQRVNQ